MPVLNVNGKSVEKSKKILFSALNKNYHKLELNNGGKKAVVECTEIIPNAVEVAKIIPNGNPILEVQIAGMKGKQDIVLMPGETKKIEGFSISFNDSTNTEGINISLNNAGMSIYSPYELVRSEHAGQIAGNHTSQYIAPF